MCMIKFLDQYERQKYFQELVLFKHQKTQF